VSERFLSHEGFRDLTQNLARDGFCVRAPCQQAPGDFLFAEVGEDFALADGYPNSIMPPGEAFYPQEEEIFSYAPGGASVKPTLPDHQPIALVGVRPCDLAGIVLMDRFFLSDVIYERYRLRRKNSLVIVLDCTTPCKKGFCLDTGTGPLAREGFDAALFPVSDGFIVRDFSRKAENHFKILAPARPEHLKTLEGFVSRLPGEFSSRIPGSQAGFDSEPPAKSSLAWPYLARRCFSCGGCCYICPTCYCHNTFERDGSFIRERDSCLLSGYHWLTGGGSLRPTGEERLQYRKECKLSGAIHGKRMGRKPCVGCGRCSWTCIGYATMKAYFGKKEALQ